MKLVVFIEIVKYFLFLRGTTGWKNVTLQVVPTDNIIKESISPYRIFVTNYAKEVTISCSGNCPLQWSLENNAFTTYLAERRKWIEFTNSRTYGGLWGYKYTANVTLKGMTNKLTGNYTCQCANATRERNQKFDNLKSIFVYWKGEPKLSSLLQAGETGVVPRNKVQPWIRLYCGVSQPFLTVYLFTNEIRLSPDDVSIVQDDYGFKVNLHELYRRGIIKSSDEGPVFYCSLKSSMHLDNASQNTDLAKWSVIEDQNPKPRKLIFLKRFHSVTSDSEGLFQYDLSANTLICCYDGKRFLQNVSIATDNESCYSSCTEVDGFEPNNEAFPFRCNIPEQTEGAMNLETFYAMNYTSRCTIEDAQNHHGNFIDLKVNVPLSDHFLSGNLKYGCRHATNFLAEGKVRMLNYMHGTRTRITVENTGHDWKPTDYIHPNVDESNDINTDWLSLRIEVRNMKELVCLVPVRTSDHWWNTTIDFHLKGESHPTVASHLDDPDEEEIHTFSSSIQLQCSSIGFTRPEIFWSGGENLTNGGTTDVRAVVEPPSAASSSSTSPEDHVYVVSTLNLVVSESSIGKYICTVKTQVGHVSKNRKSEHFSNTPSQNVGVVVGIVLFCASFLRLSSLRKKGSLLLQKRSVLSSKEVEQFGNGDTEALAKLTREDIYVNDAYHLLPYNTEYEVPHEDLHMDYSSVLGQGTFGMVVMGQLKRGNSEELTVAVKTLKPNENTNNFKAMLCELKIMAYLGSHRNIVSLLGASTRKVQSRELMVAMEYCENGNLHDFLRNGRTDFRDFFSHSLHHYSWEAATGYSNPELKISTFDLLKWSEEVATGMEFLFSKRVIHADLACRNILLTKQKVAKVGDFGLSKHIFHYSSYKKHGVQLLPWRWMAPESLTDMTFSFETDAWAFGVTIWEIFTLAQTPYPEMLWNANFMKKLKTGYRLPKPDFLRQQIYEFVMLPCWTKDPKQRPSFESLRSQFQELIVALSETTGQHEVSD